MENLVTLSIESISNYLNDEDPEFAIAKVSFLSTKENSHGLPITEELLREYSHTVLGKWLVGKMDFMEKDVMSHEMKQNIFGYFPKDQKVVFEYDESGEYLIASANAVISKIYAESFYKIFINDNFRNVSVEMLTDRQDDDSPINAFHIVGVTALNKTINGSCPDANMEIIQFSEEHANKFYEKMNSETALTKFAQDREKTLKLSNKEILDLEKGKEETMAKPIDKKVEDVKEKEEIVKAEETVDMANTEEGLCGDKMSDEPKDEPKEEPVVEEEKMSSDANVDASATAKMLEDEAKRNADMLAEKENVIMEQMAELEELRKFKEDVESEKKETEITQTLAKVKDHVDKETYEKFEKSAEAYKFSEINTWKNEVLATVTLNVIQFAETKTESHLRMGLNQDSTEPKSLWERLK